MFSNVFSHILCNCGLQVIHRSGEKGGDHVCTQCGKCFKTKQRLRAHEVRHTGARPHVCRSCGGAFPDRGGLAKHVRTVHATHGGRYACPACGKTTNRLDNLRVHMRTHADPSLANLSAEQLTVSPSISLAYDKKTATEPIPEPVLVDPAPPPVSAETPVPVTAGPAPISAFCFLPGKSDVVVGNHLSRYAAAVPGGTVGGGGGMVDLFQDSGAYVQHCLSFVTLPTSDYIGPHPQTDLTAQTLSSSIHHHQS